MANYSDSKCPKCGNTSFEMVEDVPNGSKFKIMFIRCESCNTVVSTEPFFNTGYLIQKLAEGLNIDLEKLL